MILKLTKLPKKLRIKSKKRCNTQETLKLMLSERLEQLSLQDSKLSDWKCPIAFLDGVLHWLLNELIKKLCEEYN